MFDKIEACLFVYFLKKLCGSRVGGGTQPEGSSKRKPESNSGTFA
jgi:hypothetical protein